MKARQTTIQFREQDFNVDYCVMKIAGQTFLMVNGEQIPDLCEQWEINKATVNHFRTLGIECDRIAVKQRGWYEIEVDGGRAKYLRNIHGSVPSCAPIEIPYLMRSSHGARAAYF